LWEQLVVAFEVREEAGVGKGVGKGVGSVVGSAVAEIGVAGLVGWL
jgi:hypothetical protein